MKKIITLTVLIFMMTSSVFGHSIFKKEETTEIDKTLPFLINIYSENSNDVTENFEEPKLVNNHQVHFYNKSNENEEKQESSNFFVTARRTKNIDLFRSYVDKVELTSSHVFGKWDLSGSVYQEAISGNNNYKNYVSIEPSYKLNDKISLFGGVSHSLTNNYDQTKIGIKWTPVKFNRLEFKVSVSNYTKQFYNYRNRLNFESTFKI